MTESVRTIPAFSVSLEVNAQKLVSLYHDLSEPISRSAGAKLTYTDLLFRALALALAGMPAMNAVWEGEVRQRSQIILGLAVATDRGVVAPVISDVDRLPLTQLITRRAAITEKARQSRLSFADLEGGVGTLSNLGMYRVDRFEGIITPGQSFILAAGKFASGPGSKRSRWSFGQPSSSTCQWITALPTVPSQRPFSSGSPRSLKIPIECSGMSSTKLVATLASADKPTETWTSPDGSSALVLPYGGRILGLFAPESEQNFFWTHPALDAAETARDFYKSAQWHNSGGDRTWLAPEVDFFFPNFPNLDPYWQPREFDPGNYQLTTSKGSMVLTNRFTYKLSRSQQTVDLEVSKRLTPAANPLRNFDLQDVELCGLYAAHQPGFCRRQGRLRRRWVFGACFNCPTVGRCSFRRFREPRSRPSLGMSMPAIFRSRRIWCATTCGRRESISWACRHGQ